jgi:hypothetical protein
MHDIASQRQFLLSSNARIACDSFTAILLYGKPYATHYRVSCERAQLLQQIFSWSLYHKP